MMQHFLYCILILHYCNTTAKPIPGSVVSVAACCMRACLSAKLPACLTPLNFCSNQPANVLVDTSVLRYTCVHKHMLGDCLSKVITSQLHRNIIPSQPVIQLVLPEIYTNGTMQFLCAGLQADEYHYILVVYPKFCRGRAMSCIAYLQLKKTSDPNYVLLLRICSKFVHARLPQFNHMYGGVRGYI